jgi:hypothetical protein
MAVGQRRDVDGVDVGRADDRVGVVVPARDPVASGVVLRQRPISAHHGDELGVRGLAEPRTALPFGDVPATDHSPTYCFHVTLPLCSWREIALQVAPGRSGAK